MTISEQLRMHGSLFNEEALQTILGPLHLRDGLTEEFLADQRTFYYTENSRNIRSYSFNDSEEAKFKIIKFINTRNFFNHPWAFGFIKVQNSLGQWEWIGAYAGRHGELFTKMKKVVRSSRGDRQLLTKVLFPRAITRSDVFNKFTEFQEETLVASVQSKLHDKAEWDTLGGNEGLLLYLKSLIYVVRDKVLFKEECPTDVVGVDRGDSLESFIFNTGLLDEYLNFILLRVDLAKINLSFFSEPYFGVIGVEVVDDLRMYQESSELPVVHLIADDEALKFPSASIELGSSKDLEHIFTYRKNRLTETLADVPTESLVNYLHYSVSLASKKVKVDSQYLVPFYNMKWGKVSFLMPYYATHISTTVPVCAIVIGEVRPGIWSPVTALQLETARSNARLLGRVNASWLINTKVVQ